MAKKKSTTSKTGKEMRKKMDGFVKGKFKKTKKK